MVTVSLHIIVLAHRGIIVTTIQQHHTSLLISDSSSEGSSPNIEIIAQISITIGTPFILEIFQNSVGVGVVPSKSVFILCPVTICEKTSSL